MNGRACGIVAVAVLLISGLGIADSAKIPSDGRLEGVCYGPFRDNENPDMGVFPTTDEIKADMELVARLTPAVRTYGCGQTLKSIPGICDSLGIDVYPGAWLSKYEVENRREVQDIIQIGSQGLAHVKGLIVGNEVLLRGDMTEGELAGCIRQVKTAVHVPVTTAETWSVWLKHPDLAHEVSFILVHVHPYWEGVSVNQAAEYVVTIWKEMKTAFPGKAVVIGETGWPSRGKVIGQAVPSAENQQRFFREFSQLAQGEGIQYFYFDLFDEKWKDGAEEQAGAHWGVYSSDGSPKPEMKMLLTSQARGGISRPVSQLHSIKVEAPLIVYAEEPSDARRFTPSGWMGDLDCIDLNIACTTEPHSGKTCVRMRYTPTRGGSQGWSAVYWQYPQNNWGRYPGYELSGAIRLTFWARGEVWGEKGEFKVGGIRGQGPDEPYADSFGPVSTGVLELTKDWKQYSIDLRGTDMSTVIGGFCWATNSRQNRKGCTIYIDDIVFETGHAGR